MVLWSNLSVKLTVSLVYNYRTVTTGFRFFAECLRHSAKARLHSAKPLSSAALGKEHTAKKIDQQSPLWRVSFIGHSAKALPSARKPLGKEKLPDGAN